jgi:hypothetical protein
MGSSLASNKGKEVEEAKELNVGIRMLWSNREAAKSGVMYTFCGGFVLVHG